MSHRLTVFTAVSALACTGVMMCAPAQASLPQAQKDHARLCADLEVSVSLRSLSAQITELTYAVTNIGRLGFESIGGSQALILSDGQKIVRRSAFKAVPAGATRSFRVYYRGGARPRRPSVVIALDPKGFADGNPRNVDCNLSNNFAQLAPARDDMRRPRSPVNAAVPPR